MENNSLPLEKQFKVQLEVQKLDFYLKKNPEQAHEQALNYCEDFLTLAQQYKLLEAELKALKEKQSSHPSLPPFKARKNK
ncbi:MAG: hypothetical protein QNJ60_12955 [Xenococcaceae cyanobacterium MO_188.B19]|nr:hypothetical protein [Xenococcaceae cyanobacterium MO_188.B19]